MGNENFLLGRCCYSRFWDYNDYLFFISTSWIIVDYVRTIIHNTPSVVVYLKIKLIMKRLLLLLIIPTLSYSQITFEDIMSINSEKTFKRVMIENGLEYDESGNFGKQYIFYGLNIRKDSLEGNKSSLWGSYYKRNGEFRFQISLWKGLFSDDDDNLYDLLVEKIKKNCTFYDVLNENGDDFVCYSCPQSMYKGKIGFTKIDGSGVIKHIIETKPITYNDIMSINSEDTYKKVMVDIGYELDIPNDTTIRYGLDIQKDTIRGYNVSSEWMVYDKRSKEFRLYWWYTNKDFILKERDPSEHPYNIILDDVKEKCTFYDKVDIDDYNYDFYDCDESSFNGRVGFVMTDTICFIQQLIKPTKE